MTFNNYYHYALISEFIDTENKKNSQLMAKLEKLKTFSCKNEVNSYIRNVFGNESCNGYLTNNCFIETTETENYYTVNVSLNNKKLLYIYNN